MLYLEKGDVFDAREGKEHDGDERGEFGQKEEKRLALVDDDQAVRRAIRQTVDKEKHFANLASPLAQRRYKHTIVSRTHKQWRKGNREFVHG